MPLKPQTSTIIVVDGILGQLQLENPDFNTALVALQKMWLENKDDSLDEDLKTSVGKAFNLYLTHVYPKTGVSKEIDAQQEINNVMALLNQNSADFIAPFAPQTTKQKVLNFINPWAYYDDLESKAYNMDVYLQNLAATHIELEEVTKTNAFGVEFTVKQHRFASS